MIAHRQSHAHTAALAHVGVGACEVADLGDDFFHECGELHAHVADGGIARFLPNDLHFGRHFKRIVRADLAAEPVFQRRDDAAAIRVVLGVRRCDEQHVERQANLVAAHLHVAFFEHVQKSDLDALGEVGQFVDGEDAAVRARHEP